MHMGSAGKNATKILEYVEYGIRSVMTSNRMGWRMIKT